MIRKAIIVVLTLGAVGDQPFHILSARQTPLEVYNRLYDHSTWPVVFDDVSSLLHDNNFIDMLKSLCESGARAVRWGTTTDRLNGREKEFTYSSTVLILLNRIPEKNPDVRAILDRCDSISFEPRKSEVIAYMRRHFPDDDDLIDSLAELPALPSVRTLIKARQWAKSANLDVYEELMAECGVDEPVRRLIDIMQTSPMGEWCARFVQATGLSERTYRRHRAGADEILACRRDGVDGQTDIDSRMALLYDTVETRS